MASSAIVRWGASLLMLLALLAPLHAEEDDNGYGNGRNGNGWNSNGGNANGWNGNGGSSNSWNGHNWNGNGGNGNDWSNNGGNGNGWDEEGARRSTWEPNTSLLFQRYFEPFARVPSARACRDKCVYDRRCSGWTYYDSSFQGAGSASYKLQRVCVLGAGVKDKRSGDRPGRTSGVVGQSRDDDYCGDSCRPPR